MNAIGRIFGSARAVGRHLLSSRPLRSQGALRRVFVLVAASVAAVCMALVPQSHATPITYTLAGVEVAGTNDAVCDYCNYGPAYIHGTFTFDPSNDTLTNPDISIVAPNDTTADQSVFTPDSWTETCCGQYSNLISVTDNLGVNLQIEFQNALGDAPDPVVLLDDGNSLNLCQGFCYAISGSADPTGAPEPASLALFGTAFTGLALLRCRKKNHRS